MSEQRDLMTRLREDTRTLHNQAEDQGYMRQLMEGTLPRDRFIASIRQTHLLHAGLDERLRRLRAESPRAAAVLQDHHFLVADNARRDLDFLGGASGDVEANEGVRAFLGEADRWMEENPEALLGMFYVVEGSLNGAKILVRKYSQLFGIPGPEGLTHLDPHGVAMRPRWMEFANAMNSQLWDEKTAKDMVAAACGAFRHVGHMYREIQNAAETQRAS